MLKKLLASSSGDKNGSSNIYMNGKEIYKIYRGQNLVYDVYNGRDFNYSYNYANQKFTFTNWKQAYNCVANTTHFIIADDNTIVLNDFLRTYNAQIQNITIPYNVTMTNGDISSLFYNHSKNLKYASINSHSVTNMYRTYYNCTNMKSSPTCGNNVVDMREAYYACWNLIGSPVVGPNVTDMYRAYAFCINITGSPACGDKVTSFAAAYQNCYNLTGNPVCPSNTTSMYASYLGCYNMKGNPVCGTKVVNMSSTYHDCYNLTGSPACGPNVNDMTYAYHNCYKLIGTSVCGNKVTNMYHAYSGCHSLTGSPACGENVMDMDNAYHNCYNISGNAYFYSNKVSKVQNCFNGRNTSRRLNIHVPKTGLNYSHNTLATCLYNGGSSFVGDGITWSQSGVNYYNTFYNIYIYPVDNVPYIQKAHKSAVVYTTTNTSKRPVSIIGLTNGYTSEINGSEVMLIKNTESDVVTYVGFTNDRNITGIKYMPDTINNMYNTFGYCVNLTGQPICGDNVVNMRMAYYYCYSLTGSPVCGPNVTDMRYAYYRCNNMTGQPVCGDKVTTMNHTYAECDNIKGSPVCGPNVVDMSSAYYWLEKLTGTPVCGEKVVDFANTYHHCKSITGNPVCGNNVTNMYQTYGYCYNLTGQPVCGDNVVNFGYTYISCNGLTGNFVCGNNVVNMCGTYWGCEQLTGSPICGVNVTDMGSTYKNCTNLGTNGYFYSNKITNAVNCFNGVNRSNRLNLYVPNTGDTLNTCLIANTNSIVGASVTWTNSMSVNSCYYNTTRNIYIYPVTNVEQTYKENELLIAKYTIGNGSNVIPEFEPYLQGQDTVNPVYDYSQEIEMESIDSIISIMDGNMDLLKYTSYNYSDPINNEYQFSSNGMFGIKLEKIEDGKWNISGYGGSPGMYTDIIVTYQTINQDYSIEDTVNSDNTITRTIYIDDSKIDKIPTSISFKNETDLLTVDKLKMDKITNASYMFNGCTNLTNVYTSNWDTSKITNADYMFAGCTALTELKPFELPNVKSAVCIFDGCTNLKIERGE